LRNTAAHTAAHTAALSEVEDLRDTLAFQDIPVSHSPTGLPVLDSPFGTALWVAQVFNAMAH
jgi:hypothetical protein